MAKLSRKAGATSQILQIFIQDSSSTTGAGLTGLTNASAGLTAYYHRDTDTTATAISLVTMTVGSFTSSGFKEIDSTNMPGWYQLCPPNAAFASGASSVGIHLKGATNMAPLPIEVDLDSQVDVTFIAGSVVDTTKAQLGVNTVSIGGTTQTARDIGASVLLSSGTGAGQISLSSGLVSLAAAQTCNITGNLSGSVGSVIARVTANTDQLAGQTVTAAAGVTFPTSVASPTNITAGTITTVTTAVTVDGTSALTEAYAAPKAGLTLASALYGINQMLEEFSIGGTTTTVMKRDQSTTAMTFTLDSATAPTKVTQAT